MYISFQAYLLSMKEIPIWPALLSEECIGLAKELATPPAVAMSLCLLGRVRATEGNLAAAYAHFQESLADSTDGGKLSATSLSLWKGEQMSWPGKGTSFER